MIKKNTQNYYTVEQMRANYENQNNDEDSSDDSDIMPIENNISNLSSVISNIEDILKVKSNNNKIVLDRKINMYEENKILEQLLPMINIEIKTISASNKTIITFFDAEKYRYYL